MTRKTTSSSPDLVVTKPTSIFTKPVTVDYKELFKTLAKGVGHTIAQKWDELAADAIAALTSLGLETQPGEVAYELIKRALVVSLFDLMSDSSTLLNVDPDRTEADIIDAIQSLLTDEPVVFDESFLDRPLQLSLVSRTQGILQAWLELHHSVGRSAKIIAQRFPSYFLFALNNEWRKNEKRYVVLKSAIETPFTKASIREIQWRTYASLLQKRVQEPSFDEAFSLRQIFIPPNAFVYERSKKSSKNLDESATKREKEKRIVVSLESELRSWLKNSKEEDAVRVISGGPGSGKSTFSRIFAAQLAEEDDRRTLFIPLHLIDPLQDLPDEVGRFVKNEGILTTNPLDIGSPEPNLLIIFDGLDELASQGKAAAEAARSFIGEVEKTVQRPAFVAAKLRVIVSGRELVVQENQLDFRRDRQILNILPYYVSEADRQTYDGPEYVDKAKFLKQDLRDDWWSNYGKLTGRTYEGLPQELRRPDLDEITAQPLLNYLVALSFTRGEIDFTKDVNLNAIYDDLVDAVYQRGYEKSRIYGPIKHLTVSEFFRILEEIGLAAWHGDGRTTTVSEIEQHCKSSGLETLLDKFQDGAKAGVTRLLAAFFFRQHGKRASGDQTFVFTHKSFGEFLASRRIARAMGRIVKQIQERSTSLDEGWDHREALKFWAAVCGPSPITSYIHRFLKAEVADLENVTLSQTCFSALFDHILRFGMPMELLQVSTFREQQLNARNAEEALLVALNACALVTKELCSFPGATDIAFGAWFRRVQGQRIGAQPVIAAECLSYLNLRSYHLDILDLYGADLSFSDLSGSFAHFTNFGDANLTGTNFSGSICMDAYFGAAILVDTRFEGVDLQRSLIKTSTIRKANFDGATLSQSTATDLKSKGIRLQHARVVEDVHPNLRILKGTPRALGSR